LLEFSGKNAINKPPSDLNPNRDIVSLVNLKETKKTHQKSFPEKINDIILYYNRTEKYQGKSAQVRTAGWAFLYNKELLRMDRRLFVIIGMSYAAFSISFILSGCSFSLREFLHSDTRIGRNSHSLLNGERDSDISSEALKLDQEERQIPEATLDTQYGSLPASIPPPRQQSHLSIPADV
jgi:hypothetical protein